MQIRRFSTKQLSLIWAILVLIATGNLAAAKENPDSLLSGISKNQTKVLTYPFFIGGQKIGSIVCRLTKGGELCQNGSPYAISSTLTLDFNKISIPKHVKANGQAAFDKNGQLSAYQLDMTVNGRKVAIRCQRDERVIEETLQVGSNKYRKKMVADRIPFYVVDNNMIGLWSLMVSGLDHGNKQGVSANGFIPQSMKFVMIDMRFIREESIQIGGKTYPASVYFVEPIKEMMWITDSGILAKIEAPGQQLRIGPIKIENVAK
jgi:hypothetical protein